MAALAACGLVAGCGTTTMSQAEEPAPVHGERQDQDQQAQPIDMVKTTEADWRAVARALGRPGKLSADGTVYRVGFSRTDLGVTSHGVRIKPGFALGSYAAFARYADGSTMVMGDLVVTEPELPKVTDALQRHGIAQTAVHKHLLAHEPELWWSHLHAIGRDPVAIARAVRSALDQTATPAPAAPSSPPPIDLDTSALEAALSAKGSNDGGIYKFSFARKETIASHGRVISAAMGVNTALNFQPTGGGKAAINGDLVMTAGEVQKVIQALRAGGIDIVELHQHALDDEPRLFYMHFWANANAIRLARALRAAVDASAVKPA
ncbi:DUF1259 domain-containing protein [Nonomuraea sp. 10N515B]|uniref:DUF1259 domain-containing protein n=1 Tax=Nonomuraea sp. 10N515B TaxID=3457422 RepID=UPI003FCCDEDF